MGIASRKKWKRRATRSAEKRARYDQTKLAHRIDVTNQRSVAQREALYGPIRAERARQKERAEAKHTGHIQRRRKAARLNGWRPYAQR